VSAFVDTNILIRHLTGDRPEMAARATAYLEAETELLLTDVFAEVYEDRQDRLRGDVSGRPC